MPFNMPPPGSPTWAGALVLVAIVLTCSLLARAATTRMERMRRGA
jgi:hypothetical protein